MLIGKHAFNCAERYDHGPFTEILCDECNETLMLIKVWRIGSLSVERRTKLCKRLSMVFDQVKGLSPHPNIARYLVSDGSPSDLPVLVMPKFLNGNAFEYVNKYPNLDVIPLLHGIANGVLYLHLQEPPIVHGMVCGSNILISESGVPILTDIGMGTIPFETFGLTPHHGLQKARWLAPEIINPQTLFEDDIDLDQYSNERTIPTDIYAFGMTMLELSTRRVPYCHLRRAHSVIWNIYAGRVPPRSTCSEVPEELWAIAGCCWNRDPSQRPSISVLYAWLRMLRYAMDLDSFIL